MKLRIPTGGCYLFVMDVSVVYLDVPLLIGLDLLEKFFLKGFVAPSTLESDEEQWKVPLVKNKGHLYMEFEEYQVIFTESKLINYKRIYFIRSLGGYIECSNERILMR